MVATSLRVIGAVFWGNANYGRWRNGPAFLSYRLRPWRIMGAPVQLSGLRVRYELPGVPEAEIRSIGHGIRRGMVVVVQLRMTEEWILGDRVALQIGGVERPVDADPDLEDAIVALEKPYEIAVPTLGVLELDRGSNGFRGQVRIGGRCVELFASYRETHDDRERDRAFLDDIAERFGRLDAGWSEFLDLVVIKLYPTYTKVWATETPLSRARFRKRIRAEAVDFDEERVTLYLDAGDLFGDQGIEVRFNRSLTPTEILLSG